MLNKLLYLEPGQLRRAAPFFALYLLLLGALTLADGVSLALVIARLGAAALPPLQAVAAVGVMLAAAGYVRAMRRSGTQATFIMILAAAALAVAVVCGGLSHAGTASGAVALLYVARELAHALILLHFGSYLGAYFTRAELNRMMPAIYAGGRIGGIAAGIALERLSAVVAPAELLAAVVLLMSAGIVGVAWIRRRQGAALTEPHEVTRSDAASTKTRPRGLLPLLWQSRLLLWITLTTATLFFCRSGLTLQGGMCLQRELGDEAAVAQFMGRYTQVALAVSLPIQLLLVGRLVGWIGLGASQMLYATLMLAAALVGWGELTLMGAMFMRFVDTELRLTLRNPLAQMTVNLFPLDVRAAARAWSLGMLIPLTTLAGSLLFGGLVRWEAATWISAVTALAAAAYLVFGLGLARAIRATEANLGERATITPFPQDRHRAAA